MALLKSMGRNPTGKRLQRVRQSPNYRDGAFQNVEPTVLEIKRSAMPKMLWKFMVKPKGTQPPQAVPTVKTDLKNIVADKPVVVWFGHSSYFIKSKLFTVLVDPVFSGYAAPVSFVGKAFAGSNVYAPDDFPNIDLLIITHDHYDHLDYKTVLQLQPKVKRVVTSLGVAEHLEYWGWDMGNVTELDWWESAALQDDVRITAAPARHFSGRTTRRNQTLWSSFVLELHGYRLYIGGDSGYSNQFNVIGEKFGSFDLAMLDGAQYNDMWATIHMRPEETIQAALDLHTKALMPVHWGKFAMALHPWNEPITRLQKAAAAAPTLQIVTPEIGQPFTLDTSPAFVPWWQGMG